MMIREAGEADLPLLSAIGGGDGSVPWSAGQFASALSSPPGRVCLLEGGAGRAAALIVWQTVLDESELHLIATAPAFRRQGCASRLLDYWFREAAQQGVGRLLLEVGVSNTAAQSLYRKHGFAANGRRRDYYPLPNGGREDALLMEKIC
ncbi:MAG: ribosomal protein S18-alanine N-acetyltransferase [Neisseria sp.]|nr:ribosomal protein S18-alanine N-acetyltransferase [Neisseria sp.]